MTEQANGRAATLRSSREAVGRHVLPALAIAEALVDPGHEPSKIHYVGAARGLETDAAPRDAVPHTFLDVTGLQRELERCANVRRSDAVPAQAGDRAAPPPCGLLRGSRPASWCRWAATPACRPCWPPGAWHPGHRRRATTAAPGGPAR